MSALSKLFDGMHGVIFPFAGSVAPDGFLLCGGEAHNNVQPAIVLSYIIKT